MARIVVSPDFFEEVLRAPVPIDIDAWRAPRGSATRLDLFTWLAYTIFSLRQPVFITYEKLRQHFGTTDADDRHARYNFKRLILKHLAKVRVVYPEARIEETPDGLWLRPSPPHVPIKGTHELRREARAQTADARYAAALATDKGLLPTKVPTVRRPQTANGCLGLTADPDLRAASA
ncbi:replication protein RepA [Krasilnikovia sp. MM14-A1259]|uniref:replication protein RepA n=1 Tax=Krasilnikovia sp. MM14-A1259 TaxID=3373539 RepID=UPI00381CC887